MSSNQAEPTRPRGVLTSDKYLAEGKGDDETAPLLEHVSKENEAEGDVLQSLKKARRLRWRSIYIMYFTMFLSAVTFSIVLSSLWPYLRLVDDVLATSSFLGWIVASYSFGQLIASPVFGLCADYMPTMVPLVVSLVINVVFNVFYCYAGAFGPGSAGWVLLVTRALVGFGAGIAAVVRSYVSEATTKEERTLAMTGISASQGLGFIIGPALSLACVPLGHSGLQITTIQFELNMYTGPGYIGAMLGIINLFLLGFLFRDRRIQTKQRERSYSQVKSLKFTFWRRKPTTEQFGSASGDAVSDLKESATIQHIEKHNLQSPSRHYDRLAAVVSITIFFFILFAFAVFETIATPLTMDEFAWSSKQAILYNNLFFCGLALIAIATFVLAFIVTKKCKVDERIVFMVALFLIAFGFFAVLPMSNRFPDVIMKTVSSSANQSTTASGGHNSTSNTVGCLEDWCTHVNKINFYQYIICMLLIATGYPAASLLCYTIFSKILGPFPQGTMMGFLTAAGSLARFLGPIFVGNLYHSLGPLITFSAVDGIVGVSIVVMLVFYRRLVPYKEA